MNDIFFNLAIRNADRPSPEVLQPRLPSMFEPSNPADGSPESLLDQNLSFSPQSTNRNEFENPGPSPISRESNSSSNVSIQVPPIINIKGPSHAGQFSKQPDLESTSEMTISQSIQNRQLQTPSESIHASFSSSLEEIQNDRHRSATIMSEVEKTPARTSANHPHPETEKFGERIVHPRTERLTGNKIDQLVETSRAVPGRVDKSINSLQPHEESNHAEPPIVRIHIGRIEVRAITPPPLQSASKPAPAQPRLTLDDYLRQREGRR
jgi:hypothetical protein